MVRSQSLSANKMSKLRNLTPFLAILQDQDFKLASVTDERMSGASGKMPAAIQLSSEAADSGPISQIKDSDILRFGALNGSLDNLVCDCCKRGIVHPYISDNKQGMDRKIFSVFRRTAGPASQGASIII